MSITATETLLLFLPRLVQKFTMAELAYQVDEMLFKMNSLTGSSNLPEKTMNDFTDSDATYTYGEDVVSSGSEVRNNDLVKNNLH